MKSFKTIGLLGLAFGSTNKGCEALGYGFLNVLERVAIQNEVEYRILIFENCNIELIYSNGEFNHLLLQSVPLSGISSLSKIKTNRFIFDKCDVIFDFTAGDSFSDIYGMKRFVQRSVIKILAEKSVNTFVLGSQTYGPYKSILAKIMAKKIIKKATVVYARDKMSCDRVKSLTKREADLTVDVAFAMKYNSTNILSDKIKVGFNPSGLLWNGGYTKNNQFGLTVDYKKYCREVISRLLYTNKYDIFLISHVISEDFSVIDNDNIACRELKNEFPELIEAPHFKTPVEAKSYISAMDVFSGARMHATIAAFTTGVPVIPFSYSPKFEGLFTSVGYNHVISATKEKTEDAIEETIQKIERKDILRKELNDLKPLIEEGINHLVDETLKILA